MRILFVAMPDSIHTVRWIGQIADQGWDLHLFPAEDAPNHPGLRNLTAHDGIVRSPALASSVRLENSLPWPWRASADWADAWFKYRRRSEPLVHRIASRGERLARVIRRLKPDIIHSLEIQHSGYLVSEAQRFLDGRLPRWIVTNWGSDIYLFGRLAAHVDKIRAVLASCDYYWCECQRDVALGKTFGFSGEVLPVLPNTGGFDLERVGQLRQPGPTSARRLIMLKGYQDWAGRALAGLRALELCADVLKGYRVAIYMAAPDVRLAAELFSESTGIPVEIIPAVSHEEILRRHGQARISIGLSISDAISTSFLEALVMGSLPIQSCTSCACEWVQSGDTALLVPPEDPQAIAAAIRRGVLDDAWVDQAAEANARIAAERLDAHQIKPRVIRVYQGLSNPR